MYIPTLAIIFRHNVTQKCSPASHHASHAKRCFKTFICILYSFERCYAHDQPCVL